MIQIQIMTISLRLTNFLSRWKMFNLSFFILIFILKLDESYKDYKVFNNLLLVESYNSWFRQHVFYAWFRLIFFPLEPDPWIRLSLRIRIQEAEMLVIQWIRILSTAFNPETMKSYLWDTYSTLPMIPKVFIQPNKLILQLFLTHKPIILRQDY